MSSDRNSNKQNLSETQSKPKTNDNFETKTKTNCDSNTKKTSNKSKSDNNIDVNKSNNNSSNGVTADSDRNTAKINNNFHKNNNYYRKQYNYYYSDDYYSGNRFHNSDRNRRQEYYPKNTNRYANDERYVRRHGTNDRTARNRCFDQRSKDKNSDKSESNVRNESNHSIDSKERTSSEKVEKTSIVSNTDNNLQQKLDEITALKSIFDERVLIIDENELKGRFLAEPVINTSNEFVIKYLINNNNRSNGCNQRYNGYSHRHNGYDYKSRYGSTSRSDCRSEQFCVEHLPPIELYFELPNDYPSKTNPKFLLSCKWLSTSELEKICQKLEYLWKDCKMEVLYTWFSFLQNDVINWLRINDGLDITSIINVRPKWITKTDSDSKSLTTLSKASVDRPNRHRIQFTPHSSRGFDKLDRRVVCDVMGAELIKHLKAYNEYKRKEIFNKTYISCNICFSPHLGEDCVTFPCGHMNCRTCVRDYFTSLVKDGNVNQLKCPEPECQTPAPSHMVRELISEDLFKKYDELLLESVIGTLSDVYYCPRKACGTVVIAESDSSLAHCSRCEYAFCKNCKFSYHGFDPCQVFRNADQRRVILDKYRDGTVTEKQELEKIYGKKQLIGALEEAATDRWIEEMSKRCPHCRAAIEKSDGCNKMSCWRCNTYFCWLCLTQLPLTQPYSHFNNPDSNCYNQLFHGVDINAMDDLYEDIVD